MHDFMREQAELKAWVKTLTPQQLRAAYEKQLSIYEREDIENELENAHDWYAEKYDIDEHPVTEEELADMTDLFSCLYNSEDYRYSEARESAVLRVLQRRKRKEVDA